MTTAAPDWSVTAETVQCPLCDYNLRGLTQPLCPECGYAFDWQDLLDPRRRRHEYLFEHPRHNLASFLKTVTRKFRPGRFWRTLYPSQPVSGKRLFIYWLICALVAAAPGLLLVVIELHEGSFWDLRDLRSLLGIGYPAYGVGQMIVGISLLMAFWPLVNALILLVFQQSMRRASVRPRHAVRCAIYSGDVVFWNGLWLLLVICIWHVRLDYWGWNRQVILLVIAGAAIVMLLDAVRLHSAYRHYMQFRDPFLTIAASQSVMLILFCIVTSQTLFYYLFQ
jgi:hypothetical protein